MISKFQSILIEPLNCKNWFFHLVDNLLMDTTSRKTNSLDFYETHSQANGSLEVPGVCISSAWVACASGALKNEDHY
jgi:hypothetical protein